MLPPHVVRSAQLVLAAPEESEFSELVRLAELDPARDFIGADLTGVDFGADELSAFDFRRANLAAANMAQARGVSARVLQDAKFDANTRLPAALRGHEALTGFWRSGCPSFVSAFGVDEYGQWFEFEIAASSGPVTQRLRWIAPGKFLMGSPADETGHANNEGPQHEVTIDQGFWLFDTACTQMLWQAVMGKNPSSFKGVDRPVEGVSWEDAQSFTEKINALVPGLNLTLPSEARWEYACRAGTMTPFSFGENITPEQVNYDGNYPYGGAPKGLYRQETVPVASLPANAWGLFEMSGNVWEWCADAYHENYDGAPTDGSVWQSDDRAASRVVRGGSWISLARYVRSAYRDGAEPGLRRGKVGFRCARVQDGAEPAETRRIQRSGAERIAASPSGGARPGDFSTNEHGVRIFPPGAPLVLRGDGARRLQKPAWASAVGRDEFGRWAEISVGKARQRLRWVKPGAFLMGSPETEEGRYDDEGPQHSVTIAKGYWLFDTPCTQGLWRAVMRKNPSGFKSDDRPVENVSFEDAIDFIAKINERIHGLHLSLPSEAQWEYACRAGTAGMSYAGDFEIRGENNAPGLDEIAWYGGNSGEGFELKNGYDSSDWSEKQYDHQRAGTRRVKMKRPNAWGLYDMLGNVWEWCADAWHESYDGAPNDGSVWDDAEAASRVVRGGSWIHGAQGVRSACRLGSEPGNRIVDIGFRCARVQE